jgi:polysaccharide export outer membrane protein
VPAARAEEKPKAPPERSVIEALFGGRIPPADLPLTQFGYTFFKPLEEAPIYSLPVTAEYVVGPGDELILYMWGDVFQLFETEFEPVFTLFVDRDGKIFVPRVGVFHVWGATVSDVEDILQSALDAKVKGAHIKVTVGRLRVFPVYLVGEVNQPGSVLVNGLSTVIEALSLGGGVKKTGSLRDIVLRRRQAGKIEEIEIDLYSLFVQGTPELIPLREGDVIAVPPIGPVVGVSGNVKRPHIYELTYEKTVDEVLSFAGGILPSGNLQRIQVERFHKNMKKVVLDVPLGENILGRFRLSDGDLLRVYPIYDKPENVVYLEGNVKNPGIYQHRGGMCLSELIRSAEDLLPETYLRYAEIIRRTGLDKKPVTVPFSMDEFLNHTVNPELEPLDRVKIFSRFSFPQIEIGGDVEAPGSYPFWEGITLRDILGTAVPKGDPQHLKVEVVREEKMEVEGEPEYEEAIAEPEDLKGGVVRERKIQGEKQPEREERVQAENQQGREETIRIRNHRKREETIEEFVPVRVIYLYDLLILGEEDANIPLEPAMKLVVKPVEPGERVKSVTILGRVKQPGVYAIEKGDRLSDLIEKAGGFTPTAYPFGTVFLRESVREMQEERLKTTMLAIEEGLIRQTAEAESRLTPEELQAIRLSIHRQRQILDNVRAKAELVLGRVSIAVPPEVEKLKTMNDDLLLEDGDEVYVPKLPDSTIILGEVYNPVALAHRPGKPIRYYLNEAGGLTKFSDTREIFVIKANGTVVSRRQKGFAWRKSWDTESKRFYFARKFEDIPLDPGDAIVVPSKVKIPILWRPLIRDVVQIAFQALSTVAIIDRL